MNFANILSGRQRGVGVRNPTATSLTTRVSAQNFSSLKGPPNCYGQSLLQNIPKLFAQIVLLYGWVPLMKNRSQGKRDDVLDRSYTWLFFFLRKSDIWPKIVAHPEGPSLDVGLPYALSSFSGFFCWSCSGFSALRRCTSSLESTPQRRWRLETGWKLSAPRSQRYGCECECEL